LPCKLFKGGLYEYYVFGAGNMNITPWRWFYEYLINYAFGACYMYEYYAFGASYINIMSLGWNIWILCLHPGYMNIMSSGQTIWKLCLQGRLYDYYVFMVVI